MKVGIVTFEYPGFTKNGGIGTAYGRLAKALAKKGFKVSVYFVVIDEKGLEEALEAKAALPPSSISLEIIHIPPSIAHSNSWAPARSMAVFQAIRHEKFDVLHFHDCLGLGYYSQKAKTHGLAFQETKIVVGLHGPSFWVNDAQGFFRADPQEYLLNRMERESVAMADLVVSPSQYLVDYLKSWSWEFPKKTEVIPNINDFGDGVAKVVRGKIENHPFSRIVFFGRLEPRKGFLLFLEALEKLAERTKEWDRNNFEVIFMGRDTKLADGSWAIQYAQKRLKKLEGPFKFDFIANFSSEDCREYFKKYQDTLVVMPSLMDNSPYSVLEAIEQRLNFICTTAGGQSELIHPEHHFDTICEPTPEGLADKIIFKMNNSFLLANPSAPVLAANKNWIDIHKNLIGKTRTLSRSSKSLARKGPVKKNKVAVVVNTNRNSLQLNNTLLSLRQQSVLPDEILILKWGHHNEISELNFLKLQKIYTDKKWRFVESPGSNAQDANLRAIHQTKSDYLLFLQEGDILVQDAIEVAADLVNRSQPDIGLFGMMIRDQEFYPPALEMNHTLFFDSCGKFPALVRRKFFSESSFEVFNGLRWTVEGALASIVDQNSVEVLPKVLLENPIRELFQPYLMASDAELKKRLGAITSKLPKEYGRNLELSIGLLARRI